MPKADRVNITPLKPAFEFLIQVNRLQISLMIRDPYVARAFKAAEDDGLAPSMATIDRSRMLNGGAEPVLEIVEASAMHARRIGPLGEASVRGCTVEPLRLN
jgi:hypothetical protein